MSNNDQDRVINDEDPPGSFDTVPDSSDTGESSKLKMIVQLVKKCLGVKDIASMRVISRSAFMVYGLMWSSQEAVLASVASWANS